MTFVLEVACVSTLFCVPCLPIGDPSNKVPLIAGTEEPKNGVSNEGDTGVGVEMAILLRNKICLLQKTNALN